MTCVGRITLAVCVSSLLKRVLLRFARRRYTMLPVAGWGIALYMEQNSTGSLRLQNALQHRTRPSNLRPQHKTWYPHGQKKTFASMQQQNKHNLEDKKNNPKFWQQDAD